MASLPKVDRERLVEAIDLLGDTPAGGSALKGGYATSARWPLSRCLRMAEPRPSDTGCACWTPPGGGSLIEPRSRDFLHARQWLERCLLLPLRSGDALHLALAQRQQLTVVSADRALARCAESLRLPLQLIG